MAAKKLELRDRIVLYVEKNPGVTAEQIGAHFELHSSRALNLGNELVATGRLRRATPNALVRNRGVGTGLGFYPLLPPLVKVQYPPEEDARAAG